jgi:uncharacterized membrane protein
MNEPEKYRSELKFELLIGNLLRIGVMSAGAVVLLGGILYLISYGGQVPNYHLFKGVQSDLTTVSGIVIGAFHLNARAIIQLGFLLLIATPVARVALSVFIFIRQKDIVYIIVTFIVLGILVFSLAGGHL